MPQQMLANSSPIPKWDYRWLTIAMVCVGCCFSLALWFDLALSGSRNGEAIPGDIRRIVELSEIFAHGFGAALVLIIIWQLMPDYRNRLRTLAAIIFVPGLVAQGIKRVVARRRPISYQGETPEEGLFPNSIVDTWAGFSPNGEYIYESFPSAHATGAIALAIGLSWLFPRGKYIFFTLACLASFQRISSGAHWVSDVVAGVGLAVLVSFFVFKLEGRLQARRGNKQSDTQSKNASQDDSPRLAA